MFLNYLSKSVDSVRQKAQQEKKPFKRKDVIYFFLRVAQDPLNKRHPLNRVHLLPPIKRPDKILGLAHNYKDYCDENGVGYPQEPIVFSKFASTIIGPYDKIKHPTCSQVIMVTFWFQ